MKRLLTTLLLSVIAPLSCAWADDALRFGVLAYRPKAQAIAQWQPLASHLQATLGRRVELQVYDLNELEAAVANHALDVVLTAPGQYIALKHRYGLSAPLATQMTREAGRDVAAFGGVIFTRVDATTINRLEDLADQRIALTSLDFTGGYQMQAFELLEAGLPPLDQSKLQTLGMPQDLAVQAVLNGHAEVGFVRSGVLEALTREGKLDMVRVKVIHQQTLPTFPFASSTRLYPGWPVAVTRQFSERMDRQLAVALLSLALDAVLLFRQFGAAGLYHYGGFVLSSVLLGLVFLSLAVLLSVVTRERTRASGLAIALWFGFVVVFDLLMLGLRVACGGEFGGAALAYVLLLNPTDIFRILNIFSLDQMRTLYGLTSIVPPALASPWLMGSAMLVWIALPLTLASWRFRP